MVLFSSTVSLLIFCLLDPSIADRRILIFPAIQWICLFSPVFLSVLPLIFWHSVAKYIHIKYCCEFFDSWPLYHYHYEDSLSLIIFLVVKSALSQIIIPIPAFFWCIFLLCITFNLSLSLNLKLISYRKQMVPLKKSPLYSFIFMYLFLFWILHYFMDI